MPQPGLTRCCIKGVGTFSHRKIERGGRRAIRQLGPCVPTILGAKDPEAYYMCIDPICIFRVNREAVYVQTRQICSDIIPCFSAIGGFEENIMTSSIHGVRV